MMMKKKMLATLALVPLGVALAGCNPSYVEPLQAYAKIVSECGHDLAPGSPSISTLSDEQKDDLGACISRNLDRVNMGDLAGLLKEQSVADREHFCDESWELIPYLDPKVNDTFNDVCAELILETT